MIRRVTVDQARIEFGQEIEADERRTRTGVYKDTLEAEIWRHWPDASVSVMVNDSESGGSPLLFVDCEDDEEEPAYELVKAAMRVAFAAACEVWT